MFAKCMVVSAGWLHDRIRIRSVLYNNLACIKGQDQPLYENQEPGYISIDQIHMEVIKTTTK